MSGRRLFLAAAALLAWTTSGFGPACAAPERLRVVATFTILADLVREVAGDRADVISLVGPDGDAHVFEPSPADAARIAAAGLVVSNGLGFEGWIERLARASGGKAALVVASRGVKPIREDASAGHGHDLDPHAFQDARNIKLYVGNIRDALVAADPDGAGAYRARADAYLSSLDLLDAEIRAEIAAIPPARRRVITTHDAFGYYAAAYGMSFVAPRGVSTETEISARDVARIVRQVKAEKIPAVFLENVSDPRLMERIAKETGARIGGRLYSDALSAPDGPAPTYLALMRYNTRTLRAALSD